VVQVTHNLFLYVSDINTYLESNGESSKNTIKKVKLEDFEMMKLLGYGTYGRVFLARRKITGKIYAIKVLDKKGITRSKQSELTKLERKILKCIKSKFLIRLYFAFQSATKLFLVMEY
jgi:serine/threonine protein kinase